jgi:hypothetical protein
MAVYQIRVNEKMSLGKSLVAYLQSIPQIATIEKAEKKPAPKSELYDGLNSAFAEVRLMLDGKKREKSLDEFLEEVRKEKADALRNSND